MYKKSVSVFSIGKGVAFSCGPLLPPDPDVPDMFLSNKKVVSISNYKLNLDVDELIENSTKTVSAKEFQKGTRPPPRWQNSFILYRRNKNADPIFKRKAAKYNSKEIAELWNKEPENIREIFSELAIKAKELHGAKYKGCQKRNPTKNKKKKTKKTVVNRNKAEITTNSSLECEEQFPNNPQHTSNDTPQQYTGSEIDPSTQQYMSNDVLEFSTDSIESNLVENLPADNNSYLQYMSNGALQFESNSSIFDLSEFDNTQGLILDQQSFIPGSFSPETPLPLTLPIQENNSYLQYIDDTFLSSTDSNESNPPIFHLSGLYQSDPVPLDSYLFNSDNTENATELVRFENEMLFSRFLNLSLTDVFD